MLPHSQSPELIVWSAAETFYMLVWRMQLHIQLHPSPVSETLNLMNTLLFLQVSSLLLMQVFIISPSPMKLKIINQGCHWWRTAASLSRAPITIRKVNTSLTMEETLQSCSCRVETRCLCSCQQTIVFGALTTPPPSVVFWSLSNSRQMSPKPWDHWCIYYITISV